MTVIAFGGSVEKFLLSQMMAWEFAALFISERKYKKECAAERKQSWDDTLAFLRPW